MRISDWSSDVCSSDLESDRFSIETTEDARRVPQDRTVTAPGRPGDPAPLPVVQYRQRPARSACNAGFGKLKARAGPVYPQKRSSMVNDGLPWTGRALLSTSELGRDGGAVRRSEEHTSELQSLMSISYAVFCMKKKQKQN